MCWKHSARRSCQIVTCMCTTFAKMLPVIGNSSQQKRQQVQKMPNAKSLISGRRARARKHMLSMLRARGQRPPIRKILAMSPTNQ